MRKNTLAFVVSGMLLAAAAALAYTSGVPTGLTGAPGEATCADCHGNLNTGSGGVTISAPTQYAPGETLDVTVQVHHTGQVKWGFELTVLNSSNQPVGDLVIVDPPRTQLDVDGDTGRQYVMHTEVGTDTGTPDVSPGWSFQWIAPAGARESVTFYTAAVAADDHSGTNGDFVYTTALPVQETGIADDGITWSLIKSLYR